MSGRVALVDEYGAFLSAKEGRFKLMVRGEGRFKVKWEAAPVELDSIIFTVPGASLSASAIELASRFGIDLVILKRNKPVARLLPATYGSTMATWEAQLREASTRPFRLARLFVEGKVHNQRMVLMEHARRLRSSGRPSTLLEGAVERLEGYLAQLKGAGSVDEAALIEAHAARVYWEGVASVLPPELGFKHRLTRHKLLPGERPDPFNLALNVGYAALKKEVWRAVFAAGLNPYLGFLHRPRSGRMSLVYDLMEEFRPIAVDRPLITLARRSPSKLMGGEAVTEAWRAVVNYMASSKPPLTSIIAEQARRLARHVRGTDEYRPYKSRW